MPWARKVLLVLVVGFLLFYVVSRPESAASAVRTGFGAIGTAFGATVVFFNSLAG